MNVNVGTSTTASRPHPPAHRVEERRLADPVWRSTTSPRSRDAVRHDLLRALRPAGVSVAARHALARVADRRRPERRTRASPYRQNDAATRSRGARRLDAERCINEAGRVPRRRRSPAIGIRGTTALSLLGPRDPGARFHRGRRRSEMRARSGAPLVHGC